MAGDNTTTGGTGTTPTTTTGGTGTTTTATTQGASNTAAGSSTTLDPAVIAFLHQVAPALPSAPLVLAFAATPDGTLNGNSVQYFF